MQRVRLTIYVCRGLRRNLIIVFIIAFVRASVVTDKRPPFGTIFLPPAAMTGHICSDEPQYLLVARVELFICLLPLLLSGVLFRYR
jgi:hypothetical protein